MRLGIIAVASTAALGAVLMGTGSASATSALPLTFPTGVNFSLVNYLSNANWWNESDGQAITTNGPYTTMYAEGGSSQELIDQNTGLCETYIPSTNLIGERICTASNRQEWQSPTAGGSLIHYLKVNYLGSGKCATQGPSVGDPTGMQTCSGERKQKWLYAQIV